MRKFLCPPDDRAMGKRRIEPENQMLGPRNGWMATITECSTAEMDFDGYRSSRDERKRSRVFDSDNVDPNMRILSEQVCLSPSKIY